MPPLSNTGLKYLIRTRKMTPHGDRRDRAESGGAEHQSAPVSPGHDRVVRELVLNNHFSDHGRVQPARLLPTPPQDVGQRFQLGELGLHVREVCRGKASSILNLHGGSTE